MDGGAAGVPKGSSSARIRDRETPSGGRNILTLVREGSLRRMLKYFSMAHNEYQVVSAPNANQLQVEMRPWTSKGFKPILMSSSASGPSGQHGVNAITVILELVVGQK